MRTDNGVKVTKNPVKGRIVSMSKDGHSARVEVESVVPHARYSKRLHRISTYHVHVNQQGVQPGALVEMLPCRRVSKSKSWKVVNVL